jgi:hypothetical protein
LRRTDGAHRLQSQYGRIKSPVDDRLAQRCFKAITLREPVLNRASMFVKRQLLPLVAKRILA